MVQWQVQAKQARLFEQDKRAVLRDVALTFYGAGGDEVTVHGEEGTLDTATKNFRLANRQTPIVVETRSGYTIYTNHLVWTDEAREIRTEDPVRMVGHGLEVRGHGLIGRMESEEFEVLQDVHVDLASSVPSVSDPRRQSSSTESVNQTRSAEASSVPTTLLQENDRPESRQPGHF